MHIHIYEPKDEIIYFILFYIYFILYIFYLFIKFFRANEFKHIKAYSNWRLLHMWNSFASLQVAEILRCVLIEQYILILDDLLNQ